MSSLQSLILFLTVFIDFIINNSLVIMTCLIFFFPLHSWMLLWQFLIWGIFNSHFVPILGDFMRYLVRILINFIINGSLVIMTRLYSSFLYLSFEFFGCFWQYSIWGIFNSHFLPILGDFVRYLVRILIDFIINGSLVIMTWLYSSFLHLSFAIFVCCFSNS